MINYSDAADGEDFWVDQLGRHHPLQGVGVDEQGGWVDHVEDPCQSCLLDGFNVGLELADLLRFVVSDEEEGVNSSCEAVLECGVLSPIGFSWEALAEDQLFELKEREVPEGSTPWWKGFCSFLEVQLEGAGGVGAGSWEGEGQIGKVVQKAVSEWGGEGPGRESPRGDPALEFHDAGDLHAAIQESRDE